MPRFAVGTQGLSVPSHPCPLARRVAIFPGTGPEGQIEGGDGRGCTERSVTFRPGMDTRQGTHMESFLLTRSVSGLLMNGCCQSEERRRGQGGAGRAQGGCPGVGPQGSPCSPRVPRLGWQPQMPATS